MTGMIEDLKKYSSKHRCMYVFIKSLVPCVSNEAVIRPLFKIAIVHRNGIGKYAIIMPLVVSSGYIIS